nr:arginine--tRNA ligase [Prolixibacteraceae bacterium]
MNLNQLIQEKVSVAIKMIYDVDVDPSTVQIQLTRKEFEGDLTVVVFPFTRYSRKSPEQTAQEIGVYLSVHVDEISRFNGVKGFLNLKIAPGYWLHKLSSAFADPMYGIRSANPDAPLAMVEYSSPNTNKPLHLGHIRNNLLGFSIAEILKANAWKVIKTNIVNDRGIHICKSMYAWLMDNNRETPESSGKKGDHLVGDYYVKFDQLYKREVARLVQEGMEQEKAEKEAPSMLAVREMLRKWEENDPEIRQLWKTMNAWVYAGFDITYKRLGVDFDKIYYESDTYEVGKSEVIRGLNEGVFSRHNDGSVWVDLENEGL